VENRNKKSITLDLRKPEGRDLLLRLVEHVDAWSRTSVRAPLRNGAGWEALKACNSRLIMLRISGFGQTGPYRERAGYDRIAMAFGGLMGITGFPTARLYVSALIADYQSAILGRSR
jgi:crotonobetainyl-CoA:carnitine CoA-transferase CaiB-like acyl-CoA transferase